MPNLDLSFTITAIIALTSLISPWISNIINNRHQRKMKLLEYEQERYNQTVIYKREIFENYVSSLETVISVHNAETLNNYNKYYSLAYLYCNNATLKDSIFKLHQKVIDFEVNIPDKEVEQVIDEISAIIATLK